MSGSEGINKPTQRLPTIVAPLLRVFASPSGFAIGVALTLVRHAVAPLLLDFKDGLYFPTVAFFAGSDPYSPAYLAEYGVTSPFPYPPHALLLFRPFTLLPYGAAKLVYLVFALAMIVAIARVSVRLAGLESSPSWFWGAATALLVSRPGHMAVIEGQPSLIVIVAALAALDDRARPWVRTVALAITTIKPTFGAPLLALALARGRWREAVLAGVIAVACAVPPTLGLIDHAGGLTPFLTELRTNQAAWLRNPDNDPSLSIYRIDAPAFVSRLVGAAPADRGGGRAHGVARRIGSARGAKTRGRRGPTGPARDGARGDDGAGLHLHQTYDLLLLTPVGLALAASGTHRIVLGLLAVAALNHFATYALIAGSASAARRGSS
jgi:hypothetical protein